MFALEDATWLAIVSAVGTACLALGHGIKWLLDRSETGRKTTLGEWQEIVGALKKQNDRQQAQIDDMLDTIRRMINLHAACRAENQEQYGFMTLLYNIAKRMASTLAKAGLPVEDVPDLPPKPTRIDDDEIEYLRRKTEHNSTLAKQAKANEDTAGGRRPGE